MKTLDRYIAASFIKNFWVASLGLTFVFVFQAILGGIIDKDYTLRQLIIYHCLQIPNIFVQMAPPSVLMTTVFTLSGFNRSNELVACYSIGYGIKRFLTLFISLALLVCCMVLFLQDRILPPLYHRQTNYLWREMKKRNDFVVDVSQNRIWYRSKNLIYNLRAFDSKSQTILGMTVYSFDDRFNLRETLEAETAKYTPSGWKLFNGAITQFQINEAFPKHQAFKEIQLQIPETPKDFKEVDKKVDGLRLRQLYAYINQLKKAGLDTKEHQVKLHSRLSQSFIPIVMCILGVPFSIRGRREGGVAKDLTACLVITFFYWLFYSIGLSLGTNGNITPWIAAWTPTLLFTVFALFLVRRKQS